MWKIYRDDLIRWMTILQEWVIIALVSIGLITLNSKIKRRYFDNFEELAILVHLNILVTRPVLLP